MRSFFVVYILYKIGDSFYYILVGLTYFPQIHFLCLQRSKMPLLGHYHRDLPWLVVMLILIPWALSRSTYSPEQYFNSLFLSEMDKIICISTSYGHLKCSQWKFSGQGPTPSPQGISHYFSGKGIYYSCKVYESC